MNNHKDLDVWKHSIDFVEIVYKLTHTFPKEENYGLKSQICRAVVSIPSNIAEGAARQGNKEFIHFLYIALGSLSEVETQIIIANRLKYIDNIELYINNIVKIRQMLFGLIKYLKGK